LAYLTKELHFQPLFLVNPAEFWKLLIVSGHLPLGVFFTRDMLIFLLTAYHIHLTKISNNISGNASHRNNKMSFLIKSTVDLTFLNKYLIKIVEIRKAALRLAYN
jgi:hypothetical protein